ncbi:hypothetical protein ACIQ7D_00565 [Streptomyces sp. NPDC096310]|uniref:hypothetical protein n=1 Tax=Streptomyces sp. NPDC096310 TaxID=3366082 RepID=UPI00380BEE6F
MRLHLGAEKADGLIAADLKLTGALTALLAALPSLVGEEERRMADASDPHRVHTVDLTDW